MKKIILILVITIISYQLQSQSKADLEEVTKKKSRQTLDSKDYIKKEFYKRQKEVNEFERKLLNEKQKEYTLKELFEFEVPMNRDNLVQEKEIITDLKNNKFNFSIFKVGDITIGKTHSVVSVKILEEKFPKGFGIGKVKIYIVIDDNIKHCPIQGELTLNYILDKHYNFWLLFSEEYTYNNFRKANC